MNITLPKYKYKFSILSLHYQKVDLARKRLNEFNTYMMDREDTEIIMIDNGSDTDEIATLFKQASNTITPFIIDENCGFGGAYNKAAEIALGEILIIVSSDVQAKGDYLADPHYIQDHVRSNGLACHRLYDWGTGWNQFGEKIIPYGEGYWLALTKKVWDMVDGFDAETFYPYDYEDIDLSMKMQNFDWGTYKSPAAGTLEEFPHLPIVHQHAATIGSTPERFEHTVKMRARFAKKWGLSNVPERP